MQPTIIPIKITKNGVSPYIEPQKIGATYDNMAVKFVFERPDEYINSDMILIFGGFSRVFLGRENEFIIPSSLTQLGKSIEFQIVFTLGEIQVHTNVVWLHFTRSLKEGEIPIEPLPDILLKLSQESFTGATYEEDLLKFSNMTGDTIAEIEISGGGTGTSNYNALSNKPKINNIELSGNKNSDELNLQSKLGNGNAINIQDGKINVIEPDIHFNLLANLDLPNVLLPSTISGLVQFQTQTAQGLNSLETLKANKSLDNVNLKTINGNDIRGIGNIDVSGFGEDGYSPTITVKTNTADTYILTVSYKDGNGIIQTYDTPNLKGADGTPETPGSSGQDGATYFPEINEGWLSWRNDKGYPNPDPVYIIGADGAQGLQGIPGAKGDTGAQGIQGIKGDTGEQGIPGQAATISVGTTTTLAPGTNASVTNVGTANAAILNFAIPRGAPGEGGGGSGAVGNGSITYYHVPRKDSSYDIDLKLGDILIIRSIGGCSFIVNGQNQYELNFAATLYVVEDSSGYTVIIDNPSEWDVIFERTTPNNGIITINLFRIDPNAAVSITVISEV